MRNNGMELNKGREGVHKKLYKWQKKRDSLDCFFSCEETLCLVVCTNEDMERARRVHLRLEMEVFSFFFLCFFVGVSGLVLALV